ncbi:MAG: hypothetical protein KDD38_02225 [Bdellovibrionales bacterium]|nr:hypothetical protein [Bdellovibrionales bacterium]
MEGELAMEPFFIILNYLSAFLLLAMAVSIWLHPIRTEFQKSLSALFIFRAFSQWLLAFGMAQQSEYIGHIITIVFVLVSVHSAYAYIKFRFFKFSNLNKKDLPILRFLLTVPLFALTFAITNHLYFTHALDTNYALYSGFYSLTISHIVSRMYFYPGANAVMREVKIIIFAAAYSALTSGILFLMGTVIDSQLQYLTTVGTIYACSIVLSSLFAQFSIMAKKDSTQYLNILSELDKSTLPAFIRDLSRTGMLKKVDVVSPEQIQKLHCLDAYGLMTHGAVYTLSFIEESLQEIKVNKTNVSALLAIRTLLQHYGTHAITRIGDTRYMLVASQEALSSPIVFQSILVHVSVLIERFINPALAKSWSVLPTISVTPR